MVAILTCRFLVKKTKEVEADSLPIEANSLPSDTDSLPIGDLAPFSTEGIPPKKEPTDPVKKFLGMWMTSGYASQPNDDTYTVQGRPVTLYTDASRSVWDVLISPTSWAHHQWYTSSNGKKWTTMDGSTSDKRDLTVSSNTVGTTYYQQRTAWYMLIGPTKLDPTVWSHVLAVHTLDKDIDADNIDVTLDDDYLYNQENEITSTTTYARARVTPPEYTGTIKWSVDRPDLATIDENTGLISANTRSQSGKVTVTATGYNENSGKEFQNHAILTVGGGLEDQTVDVGSKATFKLMGNIGEFEQQDDAKYEIRWFREDPITGKQEEIELDNNAISHQTDETTIDDDGAEYSAHITVMKGKKPYPTYDTNGAKLKVLTKDGPNIEMNDKLENTTYDKNPDSDRMLYDVIANDKVTYKTTMKNNSTSSRLNDATYTLPLRQDSTIDKVLVDGKELTDEDYDISTESNGNKEILKIHNLDFGIQSEHDLEVQTTVKNISKRDDFSSTGYLMGVATTGKDYQKIGESRSMSLVTDKLEYETKPIDYGVVRPIGNKKTIYRQNDASNWPNNVISVDDMRRNKSAVQLYIQQEVPFHDSKALHTLYGHLKFDDDGNEKNLLSEPALVAHSDEGKAMNSLSWRADKGVLLEMDNKMNVSGSYETKLDWTFVDSVENV